MRFPTSKHWWKFLSGARTARNMKDSAVNVDKTLAGVEPGREVSVAGYLNLPGGEQQHLQAYGLLPGRRIRVLAQRPVTIVQIEQTELAFEGAVAASVLVGD